jgi:hypothetical protein
VPLLALTAISAFLYFAFVKKKRADPSDRRDEDHSNQEHSSHHVD